MGVEPGVARDLLTLNGDETLAVLSSCDSTGLRLSRAEDGTQSSEIRWGRPPDDQPWKWLDMGPGKLALPSAIDRSVRHLNPWLRRCYKEGMRRRLRNRFTPSF